MLARKAAVDEVGGMDERFFLYCEETDLCLRLRQAGWTVVHFPQMTIFHQSRTIVGDVLSRQMAFARRQYMAKHCSRASRVAGIAALALGYGLRSIKPGRGTDARRRRSASRSAFAALLGLTPPPFGHPSTDIGETHTNDERHPAT
jgi:GT2 family glycosyltransferase